MNDKPFYIRVYKRDTKNRDALLGQRKDVKPFKKYAKRRPVDKLSAPPMVESQSTGEFLGHLALDIIGFLEIPIGPVTIGAVADAANGIWYLTDSYKHFETFSEYGFSYNDLVTTDEKELAKQQEASEALTDGIVSALFGCLSLISIFPGVGDIFAKSIKLALFAKKPAAVEKSLAHIAKHSDELHKFLEKARQAGMPASEISKIEKSIAELEKVSKNKALRDRLFGAAKKTYKVVTAPVKIAVGVTKRAIGIGSDYAKYQKIKNHTQELLQPEKTETLREKLNQVLDPSKKEEIIRSLVTKYLPSEKDIENIVKSLANDKSIGDYGEALLGVFAIGGGITGELLDSAIKSTPNSKNIIRRYRTKIASPGKSALIMGDSQMAGAIGRELKKQLESRGVKVYGGPGTTFARVSASINDFLTNSEAFDRIEELKPETIFINLGGNGSVSSATQLVTKIHQLSPNSLIIFMGPPPTVISASGNERYLKLFSKRKRKNDSLKEKLSGIAYVKFVNPYDHVLGYYKEGGDGLHMTKEAANKYVQEILLNKRVASYGFLTSVVASLFSINKYKPVKTKISLDAEQQENANIIRKTFASAGLEEVVIQAAIVNSYAESGLRAGIVGDGGMSVGLFGLHKNGVAGSYARKFEPDLKKVFQDTRDLYKEERPGKKNPSFIRRRQEAGDIRFDAAENCKMMLKAQIFSGFGPDFFNSIKDNKDLSHVAAMFSKHLERPADKEGNMRRRAKLARRMF